MDDKKPNTETNSEPSVGTPAEPTNNLNIESKTPPAAPSKTNPAVPPEIDPLANFTMPEPTSHKIGSKFGLIVALVFLVVIIIGISLLTASKTKKTHSPTNTTTTSAIAPAQVSITPSGFDPATITVKVNQGIIWTNNDTNAHQVNSDPFPSDNTLPSFNDKEAMNLNDSWDYIFTNSGTYTYHDDLSPYKFKGTVIVKQ